MNEFLDPFARPAAYAWVIQDGELYLQLVDEVREPAAQTPAKSCDKRCKRSSCAGSCRHAQALLPELQIAKAA